MKRSRQEAIEFPANPFVALTDFVIVLLLVFVLVLLHQSVSSSRLIERMAVSNAQESLRTSLGVAPPVQVQSGDVEQSLKENGVVLKQVDGDLQRFRFPGALFYASGQPGTTSLQAEKMLIDFGKILTANQGDTSDLGSGLFKRISIEGNADRSEGDKAHVWALSLQRAQQAAALIEQQTHLAPGLIEITGRGCWGDFNLTPTPAMPAAEQARIMAYNRHLDIVVLYSGVRSQKRLTDQMQTVKGNK